jgi:hypothetical protein
MWSIADHEFWASAAERRELRSRSVRLRRAIMQARPSRSHSSDNLVMLSRVLEEALIVSVDGSKLSESAIKELISRIGNIIMDRFTAGETDPDVLKKIAVESVQKR